MNESTGISVDALKWLRSWGQIKRLVEEAGVTDDDLVYQIDIGPVLNNLYVDKFEGMVEIGDHPSIVRPDGGE